MSGKRVLAKNNGKRWEKGRSLKAIVSYEYGTGQPIFNQIGDRIKSAIEKICKERKSNNYCNREKRKSLTIVITIAIVGRVITKKRAIEKRSNIG